MGNAINSLVGDSELTNSLELASEAQLATHPVTRKTYSICNTSFRLITHGPGKPLKRKSISISPNSIFNFYTAFYARLESTDTTHLNFHSILSPEHSRQAIESARGAILMRIVRFVLNVQSESQETKTTLNALGVSHAKRGIHSAENEVFTRLLLRTVVSELGSRCTPEIVQAWATLLGFITIHMNRGDAEHVASSNLSVGRTSESQQIPTNVDDEKAAIMAQEASGSNTQSNVNAAPVSLQ